MTVTTTSGSTRLTCSECGMVVSSMTPVFVGDGAWRMNPCGHSDSAEVHFEPINLEER